MNIAPNLPRVLLDAIERTTRIESNPGQFPELTGRAFAPGEKLRARHRQRRVALAATAAALLRRCDRRTLRVGDQRDDGLCNGVPVVKLCEHSRLSTWRVARALRDLEAAGYVVSKQPVMKYRDAEGVERYVGLPAVRVLTPKLFARLGISDQKLARARRHAALDWQRRHGPARSAVALIASRRSVRLAAGGRAQPHDEDRARALALALVAIRQEHPDWTPAAVRGEARRRLGL